MSATLLEPRIEKLLKKYELNLHDLFHGETPVARRTGGALVAFGTKLDFERGRLAVEEAMQRISESLQRLDPTLVEAARRAANKMRYQVGRLEKRAAQAELRREEILTRHAAQIENAAVSPQDAARARNRGIVFSRQVRRRTGRATHRDRAGSLPGAQNRAAGLIAAARVSSARSFRSV